MLSRDQSQQPYRPPCTWRSPSTAPAGIPPRGASRARPGELFTAGYWTDLVAEAERGLLDFVTIEDGLGLQSDDRFQADSRTDQVRGAWTRC